MSLCPAFMGYSGRLMVFPAGLLEHSNLSNLAISSFSYCGEKLNKLMMFRQNVEKPQKKIVPTSVVENYEYA